MLRFFKWLGLIILGLILMTVVGCSTVALPRVNAKPADTVATPDLLAPISGMDAVTTKDAWEAERSPFWKDMLLSQVYGSIPPVVPVQVLSDTVLATDLLDGKASLRGVKLAFGGEESQLTIDVHFIVPNTKGPHPVVLGAGFCPNHAVLPFEQVKPPGDAPYPEFCDGSWAEPLFLFIFGRHISTPPLEDLIDKGFAFGAYYPGQIVPDSASAAPARLAALPKGDMKYGPYAAIGSWAWTALRITDFVEADPGLDGNRIILFGHSRYGKSSLLAGALDPRIAGVIAHQSGTGGASLQKDNIGEPIAEITKNYPHWFTPNYALFADRADELPFDQHALVALMAPRPLLLGNAARDKWSDPKGAFSSAKAAGKIYALYGEAEFTAKDLKDFQPNAALSYQFREGTHGITPEDWTPFLKWLDAHFSDAD